MMLLEKARQYAEDCISGKEITTFEVKKQCQWFLEDLEKQNNEYYPYYFNTKVIGIIEGILKLLNFATGLNIVGKSIYEGLENFQAFFIANIFGWRYKTDSKKFRYREVDLFIPRKNTKTFLSALIIIILMLTEDEYSEFYSICLDRDLAGEVKKAISQILSASPSVLEYFNIPKTLSGRMECTLTHSFYQPRTSEANRNNSIKPSAFIADEYGAMKDNANVEAMRSGQLNVRNPLMFRLTTAYAEDKSIMLDELAYLKKIYQETEKDDRLFALVYYATEEHLWDDTGILMANPLRIEENYEEIRRAREKALAKPSERTEFLTKNMNYFMPSNSGEEFINIDKLRKCKNTRGVFDWQGKDVYLGLDLAMTNDNTSVSMVAMKDEIIYAKSWAFIPANRIEEKNRRERTDYKRFIEEGSCFACGDEIISYEFVENFIMNIEKKYGVHVIQIGYDRMNCISTANKLDSAGYETVVVKQHSSVLHQPTKLLQESILQRKFSYDGDKLYEINFQNAKCVEDTNLNKYVNKKKSNGKVDMVVSTIIALYLLQQNIYEDGFVVQSF
ncbi:MAG: terminase large subunit [Clostridia bacterium]|nr:terminase large subunit [Clostridia bacterium]